MTRIFDSRMLTYSFFKNKRVTVFGLGLNSGGVGSVEFLVKAGAREVIVTDIKSREELAPSLARLKNYKNVTYILGQHRPEDFSHVDLVIKNPIVPWTNEYVKLAQKNGVPVEMDSSIFFALCKAPIIGVTGSKGKTTTAALIAHLLEKAGRKVVRAGLGQSSVLGELGKVEEGSTVVFELSSWRLSALAALKKSPSVAVLTNIYPDHLNYYKNIEAYIADKKNIYQYQGKSDILIANADDPTVQKMAEAAPGKVWWFSEKKHEESMLWVEDDALYARTQDGSRALIALSDIPLAKKSALANILAATAVAVRQGLTKEAIASGLRSFSGVPHRMELLGEKEGIFYYNDTTATIPEAAIASLRSFDRPVVLLAGGTDKRLDFALFAKEILNHTKAAIFFRGTATEKILLELKNLLLAEKKERVFPVVDTMAEALQAAHKVALPGDTILLSPGATSFGIFQNEFDRGEQFRKLSQ